MRPPKWTLEKVKKEAKKYKTRSEFCKGDKNAYYWAIRNGCIDEVCEGYKQLRKPKRKWTKELVTKEAKKYSSKTEFFKKEQGGYRYAWKEGLLDKLFKNQKVGRKPKGESKNG